MAHETDDRELDDAGADEGLAESDIDLDEDGQDDDDLIDEDDADNDQDEDEEADEESGEKESEGQSEAQQPDKQNPAKKIEAIGYELSNLRKQAAALQEKVDAGTATQAEGRAVKALIERLDALETEKGEVYEFLSKKDAHTLVESTKDALTRAETLEDRLAALETAINRSKLDEADRAWFADLEKQHPHVAGQSRAIFERVKAEVADELGKVGVSDPKAFNYLLGQRFQAAIATPQQDRRRSDTPSVRRSKATEGTSKSAPVRQNLAPNDADDEVFDDTYFME